MLLKLASDAFYIGPIRTRQTPLFYQQYPLVMGVGFTTLNLIRDTACMDSYRAANKLRIKECILRKKENKGKQQQHNKKDRKK